MTEVIILRHAETEVSDILKGSLDTEITHLSDYGLLTTIVTARAIRNYYKDFPTFYFAHGHYRRTIQTGEIIEKVTPTISCASDETNTPANEDISYLPQDLIYHQELLGAKPLRVRGLRERDFGSLEGQNLQNLTSFVIENTRYPTLMDFLLYGSSNDFVSLANRVGINNPKQGEDYLKVYERAYNVSYAVIEIIKYLENQRGKSVILITTHRIFGNYLINAMINSVSESHFPEEFKNDKKYARHMLRDYDLGPCRFARLEITMRSNESKVEKPYCVVKEINDRGHLVCIDNISAQERNNLIQEAKMILKMQSLKKP